MYNFYLKRNEDISGISGTGIVAEGTIFYNGKVALIWKSDTPCISIWDGIDHVMKVHGHNGKTEIIPANVEEVNR